MARFSKPTCNLPQDPVFLILIGDRDPVFLTFILEDVGEVERLREDLFGLLDLARLGQPIRNGHQGIGLPIFIFDGVGDITGSLGLAHFGQPIRNVHQGPDFIAFILEGVGEVERLGEYLFSLLDLAHLGQLIRNIHQGPDFRPFVLEGVGEVERLGKLARFGQPA